MDIKDNQGTQNWFLAKTFPLLGNFVGISFDNITKVISKEHYDGKN